MAKAKSRKLSAVKKASLVQVAPVGFAVKYQGLGSTIHLQPVSGKKTPKGVFSSLKQAKKSLVTRLKADVKKDITRITKLNVKAGKKASVKASKRKKTMAKPITPSTAE